jgi:hypothetical protein
MFTRKEFTVVRPRAVRLIATRRKNITANADARAFFARFVALWTRFAF